MLDWPYVEGLRLEDDPGTAIFWDKVGLGHNGERLADGGHLVHFVKLGFEYISGSEWQAFLEKQEKLAALNKSKRHK